MKFVVEGATIEEWIEKAKNDVNKLTHREDFEAVAIRVYFVSKSAEMGSTAALIADESTYNEFFGED